MIYEIPLSGRDHCSPPDVNEILFFAWDLEPIILLNYSLLSLTVIQLLSHVWGTVKSRRLPHNLSEQEERQHSCPSLWRHTHGIGISSAVSFRNVMQTGGELVSQKEFPQFWHFVRSYGETGTTIVTTTRATPWPGLLRMNAFCFVNVNLISGPWRWTWCRGGRSLDFFVYLPYVATLNKRPFSVFTIAVSFNCSIKDRCFVRAVQH